MLEFSDMSCSLFLSILLSCLVFVVSLAFDVVEKHIIFDIGDIAYDLPHLTSQYTSLADRGILYQWL